MREFLIIDTETGGLNPETDALLLLTMKKFRSNEVLDVVLIPHGNISQTALDVNKLEISELIKNGLNPEQAIEEITYFINQNFVKKPVVVGKNVQFDIDFINKFTNNLFANYISWRKIDLTDIALFKELEQDKQFEHLSLQKLCEHYDIEEQWHTSLGDVLATERLLEKWLEK